MVHGNFLDFIFGIAILFRATVEKCMVQFVTVEYSGQSPISKPSSQRKLAQLVIDCESTMTYN